jgi:two-component system, sensor histidine kinase YesM
MGRIRKSHSTLKIRTKIILIYISVFIFSLILTVGIFTVINERKIEKEVGEVAMQTVGALKGNLDFIFENVTQFSDLIYFDINVQKCLRETKSSSINPVTQQTIQKSIINMLLSGDYISSVFIFDNYNNYYYSYKVGPILVNKNIIKKTQWYYNLQRSNGNVIFSHKSGGVLSFPTRKEKNYITLHREIVDVDTYEQLANLMITIDESTIQNYFDEVGKEFDSKFYIVDSKGNYIIKPSNYEDKMDQYILSDQKEKKGYRTEQSGDDKLIVVQQELGIEDWKLVGTIPMSASSFGVGKFYSSWIGLILVLNLIFVFVCSLVLTRLIFKPLYKVQRHMKLVEDGQLVEMQVDKENSNEINDLKKVFNQMVISIKELIGKVKQEEKIIAKNELDIIQAQINPHFLYNTLDAVSALALLEDNKSCLKMTQALGNFYRNSLNSGQNLVSIKDEIECIESYMTILNIRYDDKITITYDIEEEIKEYKILKLILQPIVENAVHHGIRNKNGTGNIFIKGYKDEAEIILCVVDDGIGMSEDKINEILEGKTKRKKSGFGLYSSIQRISLYYDIEKPIVIVSEIGNGTQITIRVNVIKGGGDI